MIQAGEEMGMNRQLSLGPLVLGPSLVQKELMWACFETEYKGASTSSWSHAEGLLGAPGQRMAS